MVVSRAANSIKNEHLFADYEDMVKYAQEIYKGRIAYSLRYWIRILNTVDDENSDVYSFNGIQEFEEFKYGRTNT